MAPLFQKAFSIQTVPSAERFHWQQQLMEVGIKETTAHTSHITHARDTQTCDGSVRILAVRGGVGGRGAVGGGGGGVRGGEGVRCPCVNLYTVYYPP